MLREASSRNSVDSLLLVHLRAFLSSWSIFFFVSVAVVLVVVMSITLRSKKLRYKRVIPKR